MTKYSIIKKVQISLGKPFQYIGNESLSFVKVTGLKPIRDASLAVIDVCL